MVRGIRGAITAEKNTKEDILNATRELLGKIISENGVDSRDMISILFTATKDLDAAYPAVAAREMGLTEVPLACVQEMYVEGSLKQCIRILLTYHTDKKQNEIKHIYLAGAVILRPDLIK